MAGPPPGTERNRLPGARGRAGLSLYLFVGLALTTVLPAVAFAVIEGRQLEHGAHEEADNRLRMSAAAIAREARAVSEGDLRALETLAGVLEDADDWRAEVGPQLGTLHTRYGGFNFVYAADPQGISFAADTRVAGSSARQLIGIDYSDRGYVRDALATRRTSVSGVEIGRVWKRPAIHVGAPVLARDGALVGVLGASLDLDQIQDVVDAVAADFRAQHIHVVDSAGTFVAATHDPLEVLQPFERVGLPSDTPRAEESVATGTDGRRMHVVRVSVGPTLRWTLSTFEAEDDIDAMASAARRRLLLVAMGMAALGLLVSAAMANWLVRPIRALATAARHVSRGVDAEAPAPRAAEPQELAILLTVFNEMLARIRYHTTELQETVEARTTQLAAANATLEQKLVELSDAQSRLGLADRMASVGTLAAGVAHEINNPMTFVQANLEFVAEELKAIGATTGRLDRESFQEIASALEDAKEGSKRVAGIVRDLRVFSRAEDESVESVELAPIVDTCAKVAANEIRHRARLDIVRRATRPALANPGKLSQVLLNILVNAAQAIDAGAADRNRITVTTRDDPDGVAVEVSDTGHGISKENLTRVFDPFFTTKPVGQGTGLGLAICQRIVTSLGGHIALESEVGRGTTVTIVLPAAPGARPPARSDRAPGAAEPRLRVLAIDDEEQVLGVLTRVLGRTHDVATTTDPRAALERLRAGEAFDAILCDVMMPTMTGLDFFELLIRARPDLAGRLAFVTGGVFSASLTTQVEQSGRPVLMKPFALAEVREVLARIVR